MKRMKLIFTAMALIAIITIVLTGCAPEPNPVLQTFTVIMTMFQIAGIEQR
jgi:predicted small lipoprotein YifL